METIATSVLIRLEQKHKYSFSRPIDTLCEISPADTQLDLEVGFKVFFFTDSCSPDLAVQESD